MNYFHHKKGFTLVEILIVIFIFSLLSLGAVRLQRDSSFFSNIFGEQLNSVDEGRKILRPLVGEVRSMSTSHTGTYAIEAAEASTLIFYSDIDDDGLIERVRYFLDEGTLKKGVTEPTGSPLTYDTDTETVAWVIQNIANNGQDVFEYFGTGYDGTTDPIAQPVPIDEVRLIKITIIIDQDPTQPPEPVELTTQMTVRNLKDNL